MPCRICGNDMLVSILDLGNMPLANGFLSKDEIATEKTYPLEVVFCMQCKLVQLRDVVDAKTMFDDYAYMTSASGTMIRHFEGYAYQLPINPNELVVDIGSNDGTLLEFFNKRKAKVLGIEPAKNIAAIAQSKGIETITEYFTPELANKIVNEKGKARLITANNVFAHVNNINDFMWGVDILLDNKGLFVIELPWIIDMIRNNAFDAIYHEHLSYFGIIPLKNFLNEWTEGEYRIVDIQYEPNIHGGSIRISISKDPLINADPMVNRMESLEASLLHLPSLLNFADNVKRVSIQIKNHLLELKEQGKTITGYGASARGNVLLNYCGIDNKILDFLSDTTPFKQGKLSPGMHIPVFHPDEFHLYKPDYSLMLAWNFKNEILEKEQQYLKNGGTFIVPLPKMEIYK